jgi:DHA1 family inner membrane transport protein
VTSSGRDQERGLSADRDSSAPAGARNVDRPRAILSLLLVASVTEAMFLVLPSFVGALTDVLHLSPGRTGLLGSADLAGIALATATGPWWLRRIPWRRTVLWSLGAFVIANGLCFGCSEFWTLTGLRVVAGLAAGTAYVVALAGVVDTRQATRNTGLLVCMQVVFAAAGVYALDAVRIAWRLDAVFVYIEAWAIPTLIWCWQYFPDDPGGRVQTRGVHWRHIGAPGAAALAGTALYFLMIGGVWGYLEGIAREAGLTLSEIGTTLSLGLVISIIGPVVAAWLGLRIGRAIPLIITALAQIVCLYLLTRLTSFGGVVLAFFVISTVFNIVWNYVIAYFITIFDEIDASGRFVALYGMASHFTLAVGPFVGAFLIRDGHHAPLLWFGIAAVILCFALFLLAVRLNRRASSAATRA